MARTPIARSEELPEGGSIRFRIRVRGVPVEAFAIRFHGAARAWVNRCTHREVELDLGRNVFFHPDGSTLLCRAHGAMFDPVTGACVGGICSRSTALESVALEELDGTIWAIES